MSLQIWLPFNGDLHNQGLSNIQFINNGATVDTNGKIGKCYSFDGFSNTIYNRNVSINCNKLSMCCWIYRNSSSSAEGYIASLNNGSVYTDTAIGLDSSNATTIVFIGGGNSTLRATITSDTWIHVAVTYDGQNVKGYINGQKIGEQANTTILNKSQLAIGCRCDSTNSFKYYFPGKINDFRLYDHALSDKEVEEIAKGLVLHYKFDQNIDSIIYDCSGYSRNGIVQGSLTSVTSTPKYNYALGFNGNTTIDPVPSFNASGNLISEFSFTGWINRTGQSTSNANFYGGPIWTYIKANETTLYVTWYLANADKSYDSQNNWSTGLSFPLNTWVHIAIIFKDGIITIYKNGVYLRKSDRSDNGQYIRGNMGTRIGAGALQAQLSDFRVYSTALSADQVKEIYNTSMAIDNNGNIYARELVE